MRDEPDIPNPFAIGVLVRRLYFGYSFAYVPGAPDIACTTPRAKGILLSEIARAIRPYLPMRTICVRFDPLWEIEQGVDRPKGAAILAPRDRTWFSRQGVFPVRKAAVDVQPPDTVIVDLTQSEAALLESMKPKWRYNIKLAEKKGVSILTFDGVAAQGWPLERFLDLYRQTAERDGIAIHSREYYDSLFSSCEDSQVRLYLAQAENAMIAGIITLNSGPETTYLYGASSNEGRNLMPTYLLQWKAITDAKRENCGRYDMYGIPPDDNPTHPMHGLYRFKTGFGGRIVHRTGSVDAPLRPLAYAAYSIAERARAYWFKRIVKAFTKGIRRTS